MAEKVLSQVTFEIDQIDRLLAAYADLWERARENTPDLVELTAMASVLHSFYRWAAMKPGCCGCWAPIISSFTTQSLNIMGRASKRLVKNEGDRLKAQEREAMKRKGNRDEGFKRHEDDPS